MPTRASPPHPDVERLSAARGSRLADAVSVAADPGIVVAALTLLVAWRARPGWAGVGWASAALLFCVLIPYAVLALLLRSGRVTDRQIVRREQRLIPAVAALISLLAGFAVCLRAGAPRPLMALFAALVAAQVTLTLVTLATKASAHTAVIAGATAVAVVQIGPAGLIGLPLVGLVGWARARAGRHTAAQVVLGGALGAVVAGGVFALVR